LELQVVFLELYYEKAVATTNLLIEWNMSIEQRRAKIDQIDRQIIELINARYQEVLEIGRLKKNNASAIYVPEREKALLEKISKINNGPMKPDTLRAIYREIMSGALQLEHPLRITFFGQEGSFTHQAAMNKFGHSVGYHSSSSIGGVFRDIETGRADYGCVPVENSTEGAVNYTLDTLIMANVNICAEMNLRIHHNLMAKCQMAEINKVYSHPQVLGQCRTYIQEKLAGKAILEAESTTRAAAIAANEENTAAIGSTVAAELFKLNILEHNIEDSGNNTTRFLIIGHQQPERTGDDKTSICFAVRDKVGALYDSIKPFKDENISMTMIESRPTKIQNWEYCFFIDLLGHREDEAIKRAIQTVEKQCSFLKILGSYPRGV
jgi:chorismate mutase/prephenate dehydratase